MLSRAELRGQRPRGVTENVHFTESLATVVIQEYSKPGDVVLDPFAGFGTHRRCRRTMRNEDSPRFPKEQESRPEPDAGDDLAAFKTHLGVRVRHARRAVQSAGS